MGKANCSTSSQNNKRIMKARVAGVWAARQEQVWAACQKTMLGLRHVTPTKQPPTKKLKDLKAAIEAKEPRPVHTILMEQVKKNPKLGQKILPAHVPDLNPVLPPYKAPTSLKKMEWHRKILKRRKDKARTLRKKKLLAEKVKNGTADKSPKKMKLKKIAKSKLANQVAQDHAKLLQKQKASSTTTSTTTKSPKIKSEPKSTTRKIKQEKPTTPEEPIPRKRKRPADKH
ncbi:hypothetical protein Pelo_2877 [Pelomyxa schiedti]|nr:hypothetical protein Pelo_2877 [Pelomyxa schiedti]